jgi:hypothetical protein
MSSNIKLVSYLARMGVAKTAYNILVGEPERTKRERREPNSSPRLITRFKFCGAILTHAYSWNGTLTL